MGGVNPADVLRAVRWTRRLSQRELADLAGLPRSTVDRIESGQVRDPGFSTVQRILAATGYTLVVINEHGRLLRASIGETGRNDSGAHHYDHAGRRLPAHLESRKVRSNLGDWWGWGRIAWSMSDPVVPKYTYLRRFEVYPDPCGDLRWNDAT